MGTRPNLCYEWRGFRNPHPSGWRLSKERLEEEYQKGNIVILPDGKLQRRKYERDYRGATYGNNWIDIKMALGSERTGYPTQKPLALLERLIKASSNPGDIVLDPFCGCGTSVVAAEKLNRKFVGIDISLFAIDQVTKERFGWDVAVKGLPMDMESARNMAKKKPFDFETWAVRRIPGLMENDKQRGDGGIDGMGRLLRADEQGRDRVIAQVKGGKVAIDSVKAFARVIENQDAAYGIFITLESDRISSGMRAEAAKSGRVSGKARYQFWSIEDHFAGKVPDLPDMANPMTGGRLEKQARLPMSGTT